MSEDSSTTPAPLPDLEIDEPAQTPKPGRRWNDVWEGLLRLGLGEIALQVGTVIASIALILLVVWVMGRFYLTGRVETQRQPAALAVQQPNAAVRIYFFHNCCGLQFLGRSQAMADNPARLQQVHKSIVKRQPKDALFYLANLSDQMYGDRLAWAGTLVVGPGVVTEADVYGA